MEKVANWMDLGADGEAAMDELKRMVEEKGYSAITVGDWGDFAAVKSFDHKLKPEEFDITPIGTKNNFWVWHEEEDGSQS